MRFWQSPGYTPAPELIEINAAKKTWSQIRPDHLGEICICEEETMAKVKAVWIDGSADWNTPLDWNTGVVPNNDQPVKGDTYEVTLPGSTAYTVTISAGEA